jgi:hypothetical protein
MKEQNDVLRNELLELAVQMDEHVAKNKQE